MGVLEVNAWIAVAACIALPCALGAHLAAFLLFAATVVIVGIHLLPVLVPVAIVGAVLFLLGRIAATMRRTGWGIFPVRYRVVKLTW